MQRYNRFIKFANLIMRIYENDMMFVLPDVAVCPAQTVVGRSGEGGADGGGDVAQVVVSYVGAGGEAEAGGEQ